MTPLLQSLVAGSTALDVSVCGMDDIVKESHALPDANTLRFTPVPLPSFAHVLRADGGQTPASSAPNTPAASRMRVSNILKDPHLGRSPLVPPTWNLQAAKIGGPRPIPAPDFQVAPGRGTVSCRQLPDYFGFLDPTSTDMHFTNLTRATVLPAPSPQYQWCAAAVGEVQDGSLALRQSSRAELGVSTSITGFAPVASGAQPMAPATRRLEVGCTAHIRIHMQRHKSLVRGSERHTASALFNMATADVHDLDLYCPVASGFGPACDLMLDEWTHEHGMESFASKVAAYIHHIGGFTGRSYANLAWTWGAPSTNNTTERSHRSAHEHMQTLQVGVGHIETLASFMSTESMMDTAMTDTLRDDVWSTRVWDNYSRMSQFMLYPSRPVDSPLVNPIAAGVRCKVYIEEFDPHALSTNPPIKRVLTKVLLVPSALTLTHLSTMMPMLNKDGTFTLQNAAHVARALKNECVDGGCSWVQDMQALMTDPAKFIKDKQAAADTRRPRETYTFRCFIQQCCAFAVLVPVTNKEEIERLVQRWERGIPTSASGLLSNGAVMHREQIIARGHIYRCLCHGFLLRGSCVHVLLWMVAAAIMEPPACFSADRLGHARVGRPLDYGEKLSLCGAVSAMRTHILCPCVHPASLYTQHVVV